MNKTNLWVKAKDVKIQLTSEIEPGFDIGFDKNIPTETQEELRIFVNWVENNFSIPVTLWVDFEYRHYLIRRDGKRVGFLFYWSDFSSYPAFTDKNDIPEIRLPVRTEKSTVEEILYSFIQAITLYFAWICNELDDGFEPEDNDVEDILQQYMNFRKGVSSPL
ncbi:MAG: hypothetical protein E7491_02485 [Ruminococcaceae bacterium]|nr:hypothetical protein [Oscillospiraceae bacterium]